MVISPGGTVNNKPRRTYRHKISFSCFCASIRDSHRIGRRGHTPELRRGSRAVSSSSILGLTPLPAGSGQRLRPSRGERGAAAISPERTALVRACSSLQHLCCSSIYGTISPEKVGEGSGAVCSLEASFSAARGVKGCLVPHGQVQPSAIFPCAL